MEGGTIEGETPTPRPARSRGSITFGEPLSTRVWQLRHREGETVRGGDAAAEDGKEECRESLFISLLSPHFCFFQFKEEGRGKGVESEMRRRTRL